MRLLVTRPEPDAELTAAELRALGHEIIVQPMLIVAFNEPPAGLDPAALVFTSRNGVRAVTRWPQAATWHDLPVFAIGVETAALARETGFRDVRIAGGDARSVVDLIAESRPGAILYPAPRDQAADLEGQLAAIGTAVQRVEAYRTVPAERLSGEVTAALRKKRLDGALFFSRRTSSTFAELVDAAGLIETTAPLTLYAISEAAAGPLGRLRGTIRVAAHPSTREMLALLSAAG